MLVQVSGTSSWECFKGSPERTGSINVPAPDTGYLLWKVNTGSEVYSSPVVQNGKVFQVGFQRMWCLHLDTGEILWTSSVPAHHSTPAISHNKIIVGTNRGISALSTEDGSILWEYKVSGRFSKRFSLEDYIVSSPVVSEGRVVVGTRAYQFLVADGSWIGGRDDVNVICLDENTGKEKWYHKTILGVLSSPCVAHGRAFVASREILCIDLGTGRILWNSEDKYPYDTDKPMEDLFAFDSSSPALYHGVLIAGSSNMEWGTTERRYLCWRKIVAMDQYTGNILWEWIEDGALASSPAVYDGKIYFYSYDGMVRCLSLLDGQELWGASLSEPQVFNTKGFLLWPSPSVADGKVYIGSIEGVFYCLDAYTGEILWKYETGGPIRSSPAIVSGKILVSSTDGWLYCFGIDPETYRLKAENYLKEKDYGRAEEFLVKAQEYAKTNEDAEEINTLLSLVSSEREEYQERLDRISEAETLMEKADEVLWDKEYEEAEDLYAKAGEIYEELNDEFGVSFCESRITYIQERILNEGTGMNYWLLLILLLSFAFLFVIIFKMIEILRKSPE